MAISHMQNMLSSNLFSLGGGSREPQQRAMNVFLLGNRDTGSSMDRQQAGVAPPFLRSSGDNVR